MPRKSDKKRAPLGALSLIDPVYRLVGGVAGRAGAGEVAPEPVVDAGGVVVAGAVTVVPVWLDAVLV